MRPIVRGSSGTVDGRIGVNGAGAPRPSVPVPTVTVGGALLLCSETKSRPLKAGSSRAR